MGPTPHPAPPCPAQRFGHRAAHGGALRQSPNRPITDRRQRRRERPGPRRVSLSGSATASGEAESPPCAVQVHAAALCGGQWPIRRDRRAAPGRRRRGRPERQRVTSRCAAQPTETAQPRACRHTPKRWAELNRKLAQYEAAERQVHEPAHTPPQARQPRPPFEHWHGCAKARQPRSPLRAPLHPRVEV